MADKKRAEGVRGKLRSSIVYKLNLRHFLRVLGIFLLLDLLLFAAGAAVAAVFVENTVKNVEETAQTGGIPDAACAAWLSAGGVRLARVWSAPSGLRIPGTAVRTVFPGGPGGDRYLVVPEEEGKSWYTRLDGLKCYADITVGDTQLRAVLPLSTAVKAGKAVFIALWAAELLLLVSGLFSGARVIRRTLRPIAELAETARSLNTPGKGAFTPEEMAALAGKLDRINASRLDTRIAVDGTQDELRNLARAINGMLDRINESYRAQVRFVSDASHELRTPISVIQGYANLLDRWGKNDEKVLAESITAIKDEAAGMKTLVEQLLFLARGDNDTMTLQPETFDAAELLGEVLQETKMIDPGHAYDSHIRPAFVRADEALLKQALRILVDNAIKYTPAGGKITLSSHGEDGRAYLTVQDEGIGIPPEAVPRIFDRFYRADESRARATGGTGLGLAIAKWIAQRHGGYMEALSREDIGTRISIVLPAAPVPDAPAPGAPEKTQTAQDGAAGDGPAAGS